MQYWLPWPYRPRSRSRTLTATPRGQTVPELQVDEVVDAFGASSIHVKNLDKSLTRFNSRPTT